MKLLMIAGFALAAGTTSAFAQDAEVMEACEAYKAEYESNTDCACLAEQAAADEATKADIMAIQTPDDVETASDAAMAAVGACQMS